MKIRLPFLLVLAALAGCGRSSGPQTRSAPPAPVEVAVAELRTMPIQMKAIGTVEPMASVQLKSKVQGEILQVHFEDGAQVRAGDVLFSIDPRTFEATLKRAQANLAVARTTADNATEQAARYTTLIKQGVASKEQTAQILTTAASQKSELAARQADVDEAQLLLDWTQVLAPLSGRTGAALLKAGNIAQAGGETLAVINQMQPIYVAFSLPENSLADIRHWMQDSRPTVLAFSPDTGEQLDAGTLNFVDNTVDRASGMVGFKAVFPNAEEKLWPGLFVDVTVNLAEQKDVVVIPSVAVMEGQQGPQVFVVEGDTATLRKITSGRKVDEFTIVEEGLQAGENVVTTGQLRVSPGGKVAVKNPTGADTPSGAEAPASQIP